MTHDYKRHGTTTLFAALDVLAGTVIGQCMARHRHQEFIRFLNKINRAAPAERELHLIVDNYATHKHPKVRAWLERHKRFHFHFTPTSASWLNAVEGFFAKLTKQRLKRGVFKGIVDLQAAINRYLAETNDNPKPFIWAADPDAIIEKVRRGKQALKFDPLGRYPITSVAPPFAGRLVILAFGQGAAAEGPETTMPPFRSALFDRGASTAAITKNGGSLALQRRLQGFSIYLMLRRPRYWRNPNMKFPLLGIAQRQILLKSLYILSEPPLPKEFLQNLHQRSHADHTTSNNNPLHSFSIRVPEGLDQDSAKCRPAGFYPHH